MAAKVSPTLFLSVASVCLTAALIAVPFGKGTIVAGSAVFATAAGFAATAGFSATAGLAAAEGFLVLLASSVAGCEQPVTVNTGGASQARQGCRPTQHA